jgi:tRNA threonylcarbamoyladenosine biosynthesis protein TsaB
VLILALDASTPQVTVALGREEGGRRKVLAEVSTIERGASEALLVAVEDVLALGGEDLGAVDRLLVGVGPGTFTGIRVAVSTARALSLGTCARPDELSGQGSGRRAPLLVGDGAVRYRDVLSNLGRIPPDDSPFHRVSATGHILSADLEAVKPEAVVPLYVREPDAEVRRGLNPWSQR